jgi:hypothetical protein
MLEKEWAPPPNNVLQLTALRRARSGVFCVLESISARMVVALAKAARRQLNTGRSAAAQHSPTIKIPRI